MQDFKNKVIAITGGATGIGFGLAKALGADGAKIIIGEPRPEVLETAISELTALGIEAAASVLDVADLESVEAFAAFAWEQFGQVDMLINNAGISGGRGSIYNVDMAEARRVFDVNFFGIWHGCAAFSRRMVAQGTPA